MSNSQLLIAANTIWVVVAAVLVMFMQAGFAFCETGFTRAWSAIFDSNLSALITCAVLFWFGSTFGASTVKGFAIALAIGVLLSMFSAVVVTRSMMRALLTSSSRTLVESPTLLGL